MRLLFLHGAAKRSDLDPDQVRVFKILLALNADLVVVPVATDLVGQAKLSYPAFTSSKLSSTQRGELLSRNSRLKIFYSACSSNDRCNSANSSRCALTVITLRASVPPSNFSETCSTRSAPFQ